MLRTRAKTQEELCSLPVGSCIAGIPVRLHITFFVLLLIQVVAVAIIYGEPRFTLLIFVLYGPVTLLTVLIHELGHAFSTKRWGGDVGGIILWPLGGFAMCGPAEGGVTEDLLVSLAGPATHVPQALLWFALYAILHPEGAAGFSRLIVLYDLQQGGADVFFYTLAAQATVLNAVLFIFNLVIPAYPLDGGRCLAALLVLGGFRVKTAAMIIAIMAYAMGIVLVGFGIFEYLANYSANGIFLFLIGIFIVMSSVDLFRMTRAGRVNRHPLFDRPCYKEQEPPRQAEVQIPTQTVV